MQLYNEVVFINDGSRDKSRSVICNQVEKHPWVRGVNLMRNYGQHNAILCGIRATQYEIIITMDDDLQHPPEEIHKLLDKIDEGYDVVYGSPTVLPHSLWRNLFSRYNFFKLFQVAMEILTGFSTIPLRLASLLGFVYTVFGMAVFIYVLAIFLTADSVPGFPFLASIIAIFSGAQLFALGIFGEYSKQRALILNLWNTITLSIHSSTRHTIHKYPSWICSSMPGQRQFNL